MIAQIACVCKGGFVLQTGLDIHDYVTLSAADVDGAGEKLVWVKMDVAPLPTCDRGMMRSEADGRIRVSSEQGINGRSHGLDLSYI